MIIDDKIVQQYLSGQSSDSYKDNWIFHCFDHPVFEEPNYKHYEWIAKLHKKLIGQISAYKPRNYDLVKKVFADFDSIAASFTVMLVVGFADPYDAMVLEHTGKEYMVFDLIQFGQECLGENYSCHRVLTHELLHMCLHRKFPRLDALSYVESLRYKAFDEGFAHGLTYPENISGFVFDDFLQDKYDIAAERIKRSLLETNPEKQQAYLASADTGDYWEKFASIYGKLYILKNLSTICEIYKNGWNSFAPEMFGKPSRLEDINIVK